MSYSYGLVVKGSTQQVAPGVRRRLAGLAGVQVFEAYDVLGGAESNYRISAAQDLTNTLNTWFIEDLGREAPFPAGSLLYWRHYER
jgi:hypothetical protein